MIPDDPLGKDGPHLDLFLRKDMRCVFFEPEGISSPQS